MSSVMRKPSVAANVDSVHIERGQYLTVYIDTGNGERCSMEIRVTPWGKFEIFCNAAEPPEIVGFDRWYGVEE